MPRLLLGSTAGLLDATQCQRILRHPNSVISFANFDPLAATGCIGNGHPPQTAHPPIASRRIVIESIPGSVAQWRAVPQADLAPGVNDEGTWPRLVSLCG